MGWRSSGAPIPSSLMVPIMNLKAAVEKYLAVAGEFGRPMPLTGFGLSREATEAMLAAWEEDYQLHRHLELIPAGDSSSEAAAEARYVVGGIAYAGIVFRSSIRTAIG